MAAERIPPHNQEAEQGLLGAVLLRNAVFDDIIDLVQPEDFYRPSHQKIFKVMMEMRGRGTPIDCITLRSTLGDKGYLEDVGGAAYLLELQDSTSVSDHAVAYANIIRATSKLRGLIAVGADMQAMGYEGDVDAIDTTLADAMSRTTSLALASQSNAIPVGSVLESVIRQMNSGVTTCFSPPNLPDAQFAGGDLVIIGAGTSAGKTAITLDWADEWSKTKQVTYFEYEMPESALVTRLICKHAGVTFRGVRDGTLTSEQVQRVEDAAEELKSRKLKVEEVWCNNITLFAKIRREVQQGAEIIIIDHLGLIPYNQQGMTTATAIGKLVTSPLKRLASELGIVIILLVQLNREGQREGFPKLYHLRESGDIEQDGAVVLMLWSEKSIKDDTSARIKVREQSLIVAQDDLMNFDDFYIVRVGLEKNRNGALGTMWGKFYGNTFTYVFPKEVGVDLLEERPLFDERVA